MDIGWLDAPAARSPVSSDPLFNTTRCVMPSTLRQTTIWPAGNVAGFGEKDCEPLSRTMLMVTTPFDAVGVDGVGATGLPLSEESEQPDTTRLSATIAPAKMKRMMVFLYPF